MVPEAGGWALSCPRLDGLFPLYSPSSTAGYPPSPGSVWVPGSAHTKPQRPRRVHVTFFRSLCPQLGPQLSEVRVLWRVWDLPREKTLSPVPSLRSRRGLPPMYQYSLQWFLALFSAGIDNAEASDVLEERLAHLRDFVTYSFYCNVCRCVDQIPLPHCQFDAVSLTAVRLNTFCKLNRNRSISTCASDNKSTKMVNIKQIKRLISNKMNKECFKSI